MTVAIQDQTVDLMLTRLMLRLALHRHDTGHSSGAGTPLYTGEIPVGSC